MNTLLLCCKSFCENLKNSNEKIALIVCGTILLLVIIMILGSLVWYLVKHVVDPIFSYMGKAILCVFTCKKKKVCKDSSGTTKFDCADFSIENERVCSLTRELQIKAQRFIEDKKKEGLDISGKDEIFVKSVNKFVNDIYQYLESMSKSNDNTKKV